MTSPATPQQAEAIAWLREHGLSPLQGFIAMREALQAITLYSNCRSTVHTAEVALGNKDHYILTPDEIEPFHTD